MTFKELISDYTDKISGGKGDQKDPSQFDRKEILVGVYVELEHTDAVYEALSIVLDHLTEDEKYYTKLVNSGIVDEKKALDAAKRLGMMKEQHKDTVVRNLILKLIKKELQT